jgi:hypothetical protein
MGKIKLTERQILMLQQLDGKTSNKNKVLKITESQYNRLFKKGEAVKKFDKSIKKSDMLGEDTKKIDLVDFAQEVIVFIKDILSKSDHRTMQFSTYWSDMGLSKNQLLKLIKKHNLLSAVDESDLREYMAPKHGFRKNIKELYKTITEFGNGNLPAGTTDDLNAPWNQPDTSEETKEEIIIIPEEKRKFKIIYKGEDDMAIFKAGNELFVACLCDIGDINAEPVEWDGKIYMYDYEGHSDNITAQGFEDYINDMYSQGEMKPVRNDNTDKFPVPTLLTPTIQSKIMKWYGNDPKMVQAIGQMPETTTAASSGAYVGGASFDGPIKKGMSHSPAEEMGSLINDNTFGQEAVVAYAGEFKGEEPFIAAGEKWVYSWGNYNGKKDIAVYRYSTDMAYDYSWFRKTVLGIDEEISETTSTMTVGAGIGANGQGTQTTPQYAYDAPAGDGKDFWTAGNKLNKKMGNNSTPIVRGGSVTERRKLFTESEEQFLANPQDKYRSGFELDELQQLFYEYSQIRNNSNINEFDPAYASHIKPRLEAKVLEAKVIKAEKAGEDSSLFREEMNKRQEYLMALDQWKVAKFLSKHDPQRIKIKKNLLRTAKALGIDLQLEERRIIRVSQEQFNKIVESENMTKTAYPNGEMISFDDCTKFNNNTKAQDGGCSTGAIDDVVKTKKTRDSVVAENFKPQVGAGSVYAIEVVVQGAKVILKQDNGQMVVAHYDDIPQLINILNSIQ